MHKGKVLRNTYGAESKHWSVSEQANPHEDVQEYYQTHFNILSCETIRKSRIKGVQKSSAPIHLEYQIACNLSRYVTSAVSCTVMQ